MKKSFLLSLLITFSIYKSYSQTNFSTGNISIKYRIDTLYSDTLKENRTIRIYLPDSFKKENKYPVIFVLDEDWMFEPTVTNIKQLSEAGVIPPSIVVGIHSNNRNKDLRLTAEGSFTETSMKFSYFISYELEKYLTMYITKPAFSILIGHSDAAVFSEKVLTFPNQPFNGIISLSVQLEDGQLTEIKHFTQQALSKPIYHFIAGGTKDATYRLESSLKIDSLFKTVHNTNLKLKSQIYNADHSGIVARALNDGIAFIFDDYIQENDFNEQLIDSLKKLRINPLSYILTSINKINDKYNIETMPKKHGLLSVASAIVNTKDELEELINYETKIYGKDENYYAINAQRFESIKEYKDALKYWKLNLSDTSSFSNAFFYYRRPIELLAYKMNKGKDAIILADEMVKIKPIYSIYFNLLIAKICIDKQIEQKKGQVAIKYCIDNYKTGLSFKLEDAKRMSEKLNK